MDSNIDGINRNIQWKIHGKINFNSQQKKEYCASYLLEPCPVIYSFFSQYRLNTIHHRKPEEKKAKMGKATTHSREKTVNI